MKAIHLNWSLRAARFCVALYLISGAMAKIWNLKLAQRSLGSGLGLSPEGAETAALILAAVETMLAALL